MSDAELPGRVDVWRAVSKRWMVVLGTPVATALLALLFIFLVRPQFDARASLRFLEDQSPFGGKVASLLGQGGGGGLSMLAGLTGGSLAVQTEMGVLQSRDLARQLVDEMGFRVELRSPRLAGRGRVFSTVSVDPSVQEGDYLLERNGNGFNVSAKVIADRDPFRPIRSERKEKVDLGTVAPGGVLPIQGARIVLGPGAADFGKIRFRILAATDAVELFQKRLTVGQPRRDADLVEVALRWSDPQLAADATNLLVSRFIEEREALLSEDFARTADFLGWQLDSLKTELVGAEEALRGYREREQVVEPTAQATAVIEQYAELEVRRDLISAERRALADLLDQLSAEASDAGENTTSPLRRLVFFPTLFQSQATAELLSQLAELENERGALLERRTRDAREIVALDDRVHDIENELRAVAVTYLQGLENQAASLSEVLAGFRAELNRVPAVELEYLRRRRQVELLSELYLFMEVQQKEAEVTAAGESRGVRVVDNAEVPIEASLPLPGLTLAFSLLVGLGLGVGGAVALEHAAGAASAASGP